MGSIFPVVKNWQLQFFCHLVKPWKTDVHVLLCWHDKSVSSLTNLLVVTRSSMFKLGFHQKENVQCQIPAWVYKILALNFGQENWKWKPDIIYKNRGQQHRVSCDCIPIINGDTLSLWPWTSATQIECMKEYKPRWPRKHWVARWVSTSAVSAQQWTRYLVVVPTALRRCCYFLGPRTVPAN